MSSSDPHQSAVETLLGCVPVEWWNCTDPAIAHARHSSNGDNKNNNDDGEDVESDDNEEIGLEVNQSKRIKLTDHTDFPFGIPDASLSSSAQRTSTRKSKRNSMTSTMGVIKEAIKSDRARLKEADNFLAIDVEAGLPLNRPDYQELVRFPGKLFGAFNVGDIALLRQLLEAHVADDCTLSSGMMLSESIVGLKSIIEFFEMRMQVAPDLTNVIKGSRCVLEKRPKKLFLPTFGGVGIPEPAPSSPTTSGCIPDPILQYFEPSNSSALTLSGLATDIDHGHSLMHCMPSVFDDSFEYVKCIKFMIFGIGTLVYPTATHRAINFEEMIDASVMTKKEYKAMTREVAKARASGGTFTAHTRGEGRFVFNDKREIVEIDLPVKLTWFAAVEL